MFFVPALTSSAQFRNDVSYEEMNDTETVSSFKSHVRYLSSTMLEGRKAGSEGEKLAGEYVAEQLKGYGELIVRDQRVTPCCSPSYIHVSFNITITN